MAVEFFEDPMATRRELAGDFHRPQYHFLPPRNWMNDPNGVFYWQGKYHLFYQFNPYGPLWGFIHWGHASSPDLVHWQDHPLALSPEEGAGDDLGCFSGCLVDDGGIPTALYTGFVNFFDTPVLLAQAQDPDLIQWKKSEHNPVVSVKPEGVNDADFRDPYVWRQGDRWQMVLGAGMKDGESAALLYESEDLLSWDYLGPLYKHRTFESVTMWECPNFFILDGKAVLLVSLYPNTQGVYYYTGEYDGRQFTPQAHGFLEEGPILYAPQVRTFADGRTILFGWLREGRSDAAIEAAGWAGVQAIPRELALDAEGHLISQPIAEIHQLQTSSYRIEDKCLDPGQTVTLPLGGRQLDVELLLEYGGGTVVVEVLRSPDGDEVTRIGYDLAAGEGWLDTTHASRSGEAPGSRQSVKLAGKDSVKVSLRVLVDGSVIEVWFGDVSLTGRAYPTQGDATGLRLSAESGIAQVNVFSVSVMGAIWPVA